MSGHHARQLVVQVRLEVVGIGGLEACGKLADVDLGRVELHRREGHEDGIVSWTDSSRSMKFRAYRWAFMISIDVRVSFLPKMYRMTSLSR